MEIGKGECLVLLGLVVGCDVLPIYSILYRIWIVALPFLFCAAIETAG